MGRGSLLKQTFLIFILCLSSLSCGFEYDEIDSVNPLFEQEKLAESSKVIRLTIASEIEPTEIEPTVIRKIVQKLFGWVPLLGYLSEIPLNLAVALMPNLPASDLAQIPEEASIDDPDVRGLIKGIYVREIFLQLTPKDELPKKSKNKKCFLIFDCSVKKLDFIDEIRVYVARKGSKKNGMLIGFGKSSRHMSQKKTRIDFQIIRDVNLKPYLLDIEHYEIRTLFEGKPPRDSLYIQGGVVLDADIKIEI